MDFQMHRAIAKAALLSALLLLSSMAAAADDVSGAFQCNAEKISIRGAVARWEPATKKLILTLFKNPPSAEAVHYWANQASGGGGMIPQDMDYFAEVTYTLKNPGATVDHAAIQSYHFYIKCPTLQMNLIRSVFARRDMKGDFPDFTATLKPGGRLKTVLRGAEEKGMNVSTKATWELRVDTAVHVK